MLLTSLKCNLTYSVLTEKKFQALGDVEKKLGCHSDEIM